MTAAVQRYQTLRDYLLELCVHLDPEIRDSASRVLLELENGMLPTKWGRAALDDLFESLRGDVKVTELFDMGKIIEEVYINRK